MDHEVVPRPYKIICDWLLNLSQDHYGLHQRKICQSDHEVRGPMTYIWRSTLFSDMVQWVLQWERQKRCSCRRRQGPIQEKYCHNKILMNSFFLVGGGRRDDEDKGRHKNSPTWIFQNCLFWTYIKKWTHSLFGAWSFLLVPHSVYN